MNTLGSQTGKVSFINRQVYKLSQFNTIYNSLDSYPMQGLSHLLLLREQITLVTWLMLVSLKTPSIVLKWALL